MRVFVTGGTGFVGQEIVRQLIHAGHKARCLVRKGSEGRLPHLRGVECHFGDVADAASLEKVLGKCDAVIHLVGIIREFPRRGITFERLHVQATRNLVAAAEAQGVRRFLHMSANGSRADGATGYQRSKWAAEEVVRASGLEYTIFRPSLIYGPGDEVLSLLATLVRRLPVVPILGNGNYRLSPVAREDVAAAFVKALSLRESVGKAYACCGAADFSYEEIVEMVGSALGKKRVVRLHQPLWLIRSVTTPLQSFAWYPLSLGQLAMLVEGNVCDPAPFAEAFGITPRNLADDIGHSLPA